MEIKTVQEPVIRPAASQPLVAQPQEQAPKAGDLCPKCREQTLDYDGLLNLACPKCGPVACGCFT